MRGESQMKRCSELLVLAQGSLLVALMVGAAGAQNLAPIYINPTTLTKPNGYTHVVVAPDRRTVYIAGQVALDSLGQLVGGADFAAQAGRVYDNIGRALASVGGTRTDLSR